MDFGELYRQVLILTYTAEFGPEGAARLAEMSAADRNTWIKRWYDANLPAESREVPVPMHPYAAERQRLTCLNVRIERLSVAIEEGEDAASDHDMLQALQEERVAVLARMEETKLHYLQPDVVRADLSRRLQSMQRVLAVSAEGLRQGPFKILRSRDTSGLERLRSLKSVAVKAITQKNRVLLMLEDLHRRLADASEIDREGFRDQVSKVEELHAIQVALIDAIKRALRAEEDAVRANREPAPALWDDFDAKVEAFAQQVALPA